MLQHHALVLALAIVDQHGELVLAAAETRRTGPTSTVIATTPRNFFSGELSNTGVEMATIHCEVALRAEHVGERRAARGARPAPAARSRPCRSARRENSSARRNSCRWSRPSGTRTVDTPLASQKNQDGHLVRLRSDCVADGISRRELLLQRLPVRAIDELASAAAPARRRLSFGSLSRTSSS